MFRWLEVLEKEFDKAFVDVDLLLGEIDPDQADITYEGRQKMTSLSSCFAQLCHKAQTVSQINHKLEVSGGRPVGDLQRQAAACHRRVPFKKGSRGTVLQIDPPHPLPALPGLER